MIVGFSSEWPYERGRLRVLRSNDRGRTWQKYAGNPVLEHPCRDPRVFWHAPSSKWIMVLYGPDTQGQRFYTLFSSTNLLSWQKLQSLPGFYECPDLFELPVDGDAKNSRWVMVNGNGQYMLGRFDGTAFTPETELLSVDHGRNFYATMTWGDFPGDPLRRVQIVWMAYWDKISLDQPFAQQLSFPCDLSLRTTPAGVRLCRQPIPEIRALHAGETVIRNRAVSSSDDRCLTDLSGECFDLTAEVDLRRTTCHQFRLVVRGHYLTFDLDEPFMNIAGSRAALDTSTGVLRIRVLVDRLSIETFINDGSVTFTNMAFPVDAAYPLRLLVEDGDLHITELTAHRLSSIWEGQPAQSARITGECK